MMRARYCMAGKSSNWRSNGERSRRYFCRRSEENDSSPDSASTSSRRDCSLLRIWRLSLNTGTISPCDNRATATKTIAKKIIKPSDIVVTPVRLVRSFRVENFNRQINTARTKRLVETGNDAGCPKTAYYHAVLIDTLAFEPEQFRHGDDLAFHAIDLC